MRELLYFSFADLMVRVEYSGEANSLKYASNRKVSFGERVIVEQYLLTNIAPKTDYYKKQPALFIYLGVDAQLSKALNIFHLRSTLKTLVDKEKDVKASVDNLINQSMLNFYSEKIGDTILTIRQEVEKDSPEDDVLRENKQKLEELIEAYNLYSDEKLDFRQVLPQELQKFFGFESEQ